MGGKIISQEVIVKLSKQLLENCPMRDHKKEMKIMIDHDGKQSLYLAVVGYVQEREKRESQEIESKFFNKYYPRSLK